jgi:succinyl-diaminopimelate desuccinylase
VSPAQARATCNIRFNDRHSAASLQDEIAAMTAAAARDSGCAIAMEASVGGHVFLTEPGPFVACVSEAVRSVTGDAPVLSTGGGTSDARFIKDYCPVVELGLPGATMHKADEAVAVAEIAALTDVYHAVLQSYFAHAWP